ncbi:MAG: membrane integrity-associated transporter subunit PqiC [Candidatus Hydrogenedentes bacterium]|nr:membrane integrity-associated transporter subunit PqiC [Candidatus Hydrogenedentota bacterium]
MSNRRILAIAGMALLAGCVGTTPPRLYTLNMAPSGAAAPNVNIEVARLRPLDALGAGAIVVRRSEHELDTYPLDHWASNLGEMASAKLAAEFGDPIPDRQTVSITGDVLAFEQVNSTEGTAAARVAVALEIRKKSDSRYAEPLLAKTYDAQFPLAEARPPDLVAALSRGVESIAQKIVADVNALDLSAATGPSKHEALHTLDMKPSGKAAASMNVDVTLLRRSEALARNSILIRPTATSVEYYAADRWAASVSTLVSEKLESEFGAPETGRETVQVSGTILAFERADTPEGAQGHAKLDVTLQSGQQGAARPLLWKVYEASAPAADDSAGAVALALSRALEDIAAAIADDAGRIPPAPEKPAAPPVNLYRLDMTPSGKAQCNYNVMIDRIQPHDSLTRSDILIVRDSTVVDRFPNDRWASGLAELVPEKLGAEFGHPVDGRETVHVSGIISGFEQIERGDGNRAALAKLDLTVRWAGMASDAPALRHVYEAITPIDGEGAHAAVRALSRAVEEIAVQAANDINGLTPPPKPEQ